jgi:hypothetical protein
MLSFTVVLLLTTCCFTATAATINQKLQRARNMTSWAMRKSNNMPVKVLMSDMAEMTLVSFLVGPNPEDFSPVARGFCFYLAAYASVSVYVEPFVSQNNMCAPAGKKFYATSMMVSHQDSADDFNRACIEQPLCLK